MIFALFLGLSTMTNISSSLEVYLSINGLLMLAIGSSVGAVFALLVYMITLFSVPMLVAREVDFVTAMIASFQAVQNNFFNLMIWALIIAGFTFLSMLPWFLGLFLTRHYLGMRHGISMNWPQKMGKCEHHHCASRPARLSGCNR